jgi:hypothetical protein
MEDLVKQADGAGEKGEREDEPRAMPSALHDSAAPMTAEISKGEPHASAAASGEPSMLSRPQCMASHHASHQTDIEQGHKEVEALKDQGHSSASAQGEKPKEKPLTLKANKGFLKGLPQPKPKKQKTGEWSYKRAS